MWRFSLAAAGPRAQGGSRGLESLKELQPREGRLGWLWEEARKEKNKGLLGCARKDQWGCLLMERRDHLPAIISGREPSSPPPLHCGLGHHQSPSLCPHSIPTIPTSSPTPHSGSEAACKRGQVGTKLGSEAGVLWRRTFSSYHHPLVIVTTDPMLIFLSVT